MKKLYIILLIAAVFSCKPREEKDPDIGPAPAPDFTIEKIDENNYVFKNTSKDAFMVMWDFGNGATSLLHSDTAYYPFAGDYTVKLTAIGKGGKASTTKPLTVDSGDPSICQDTMFIYLTGGCDVREGKTWIVDTAAGAMGVGPLEGSGPDWWNAKANEFKANPCIYNSSFTFIMNEFKFIHENQGTSFANWEWANAKFGKNQPQYGDICVDYTPKESTWVLTKTGPGKYKLKLTNGEFLAYYEGRSEYEILTLNENTMYIRAPFGYGKDEGYRYYRLIKK